MVVNWIIVCFLGVVGWEFFTCGNFDFDKKGDIRSVSEEKPFSTDRAELNSSVTTVQKKPVDFDDLE